jgi:hypothetical protein
MRRLSAGAGCLGAVPEFSFTVTEHDPTRPWIVLAREHQTVKLDASNFFDWRQVAAAQARRRPHLPRSGG